MYRFVFSWRWIRLHVLVWLILIPAFIGLGKWQQSRYHERSAQNKVLTAAMHGTPVPIATLDAVGATVPKAERWRQVTVLGVYDTAHQYLARNRQNSGNPGFYVVTPLVTPDGTAVLVNRGWIRTAVSDMQATPPIPAPPAGTVTVTARLQTTETKANTGIKDVTAGLPTGQISLINTAALAEMSGLPLRGGYVERISSVSADSADVTVLDEPSLDSGPYLAYWFQWWLFAVVAVGAWAMIIRREAQHRAEGAAEVDFEDDEPEVEMEDESGSDNSAASADSEKSEDATPIGERREPERDRKPNHDHDHDQNENQTQITEPAL